MKQHKWHKEIHAWADGAEIQFRNYGKDDWIEIESPNWTTYYGEYRIKPPAKCITKDCMNHTNKGKFIGDLCAPCWDYITNGKGVHSQAYRNAYPKESRYLYVYQCRSDGKYEFTNSIIYGYPKIYIGKIKLEVEE